MVDPAQIAAVRSPYEGLYAESKLAQICAAHTLFRHCGRAVGHHCLNPGGVGSDIYRAESSVFRAVVGSLFISPAAASQPIVAAATTSALDGAPPRYMQ